MPVDPSSVCSFLRSAPRDPQLYEACQAYAARFDGENNFDAYSNGEFSLVRSVMPDCAVVFDVGANRGDWTELVLALNPTVSVHAFEPSAASFQLLAAKHLPARAHLNQFALGDIHGNQDLFLFGDEATSELRSLYPRNLAERFQREIPIARESVAITTCDDYCARNGITSIDCLKIDTEGHDLKVLRGASQLIADRAIRFIQFEYGQTNIESRDLLKDFFLFFEGRGYNLHKIHPEGYSHFPRYQARLENFHYQNWVAVRQT